MPRYGRKAPGDRSIFLTCGATWHATPSAFDFAPAGAKHILGSAAHAARAAELVGRDDHAVGDERVTEAARQATPALGDVLERYPVAPAGGGRIGELTRLADAALRR